MNVYFITFFGRILLCNSNLDSDDGYSGLLCLYLPHWLVYTVLFTLLTASRVNVFMHVELIVLKMISVCTIHVPKK